MKKTIFSRLMNLSLSIILASTIVLGAIHFVLIGRYVNLARTNMLIKSGERVNQLTEILVGNYSPVTLKFYQLNVDAISQSSESYIVLVSTDGNVIYSSTEAGKYFISNNIDVKEFHDISNDKNVIKSGVFNDIFSQRMLTVATPLKRNNSIYGMVLLVSPQPAVNRDTYALLSLLLISIGASAVVAFVLSYVLSSKISKPIKQLGGVAGEIAKGEFKKRGEISDVEELKELGKAFNIMAEELEKHEQVRSSFIANVSHDLRTPMTTITGFVQGILDGTIPPEKQNQYLSVVLGETKRLSNLVSTFLDVSRYEMGEVEINKTNVDINEMIRVVLTSYENIIKEKEINVNVIFDNEQSFVYADELAIHRVIANLMENAAKFVDYGGEINIEVLRRSKKTLISIENTGAEISPEDQKYIWDRFYKADKSRNQSKKGMGLGLYIVKSIINQHQEKIAIESKDNRTKFMFSLENSKS